MRRKSWRANNPVSAYNTIDLKDNSQPMGPDNLPIGLKDSKYYGGTPRNEQEGKCLIGNNNAYVDCGTLNNWTFGDASNSTKQICYFTYVSQAHNQTLFGKTRNIAANDRYGYVILSTGIVSIFTQINASSFTIPLINGDTYYLESIYNISSDELITSIYNIDGSLYESLTISYTSIIDVSSYNFLIGGYGNSAGDGGATSNFYFNGTSIWGVYTYVDDTLVHFFKCDSESSTKLFNSASPLYSGDIINYYSGLWGTQNFKSWQNDIGFTSYNEFNTSFEDTKINCTSITKVDFIFKEIGGTAVVMFGGFDSVNNSRFYIGVSPQNKIGIGYGSLNYTDLATTIEPVNNATYVISFEDNFPTATLTVNGTPFNFDVTGEQKPNISAFVGALNNNGSQSNYFTGDIYSLYLNSLPYNLSKGIPRDELNPTKDILGNDLQFKGLCPSKLKFVDTPCFKGSSSNTAYGEFQDLITLTGDYHILVEVLMDTTGSVNSMLYRAGAFLIFGVSTTQITVRFDETATATVINVLSPLVQDQRYLVEIERIGSLGYLKIDGIIQNAGGTSCSTGNYIIKGVGDGGLVPSYQMRHTLLKASFSDSSSSYLYPFVEYINNPATHLFLDVGSARNHIILINGATDNRGVATRLNGDYSQLSIGYVFKNTSIIPTTGGGAPNLSILAGVINYIPEANTVRLVSDRTTVGFEIYINGAGQLTGFIDAGTQVNQVLTNQPVKGSEIQFYYISNNGSNQSELQITVDSNPTETINSPVGEIWYFRQDQPIQLTNAKNDGTTTIKGYSFVKITEYSEDGVDLLDRGNVPIPRAYNDPAKDALGNDLTAIQDGTFLDTETKVQAVTKPRLIQAEKTTGNRFYTDVNDDVVKKSFSDFTGNPDDQHFSDVSETGKVKRITVHPNVLLRRQLDTELKLTNNI